MSASRRTSQRLSSATKKSNYFEGDSDSESRPEEEVANKRKKASNSRREATGRKSTMTGDDEEAYEDEQDQADKGHQEYGEYDEDEFDEDAPPKVTYIPLPKLRDTGGIDYEDDRLHHNTLLFLKDLKANNNRSWLKCKFDLFYFGYIAGLIVLTQSSP